MEIYKDLSTPASREFLMPCIDAQCAAVSLPKRWASSTIAAISSGVYEGLRGSDDHVEPPVAMILMKSGRAARRACAARRGRVRPSRAAEARAPWRAPPGLARGRASPPG